MKIISDKIKEKYIGLIKENNLGQQMKVIDYHGCNEIYVKFNDGTIVKCSSNNFNKGSVRNYNFPSVYGVGVIGNKYPISDNNGKLLKEYVTWSHMLSRCYNKKELLKRKSSSYANCLVCNQWLYYPTFYEWIHLQPNYYKWLNENYMLDKDIIKKHNKIYSPNTCCLVPYYINLLFTKHDKARGKYPIGVFYNKQRKCFDIGINDGVITNKNSIHLTQFSTPYLAFNKYKQLKEKNYKSKSNTRIY